MLSDQREIREKYESMDEEDIGKEITFHQPRFFCFCSRRKVFAGSKMFWRVGGLRKTRAPSTEDSEDICRFRGISRTFIIDVSRDPF